MNWMQAVTAALAIMGAGASEGSVEVKMPSGAICTVDAAGDVLDGPGECFQIRDEAVFGDEEHPSIEWCASEAATDGELEWCDGLYPGLFQALEDARDGA